MILTGGCLCGAVRYELTGEAIFSSQCHCRDCQRVSGSAFVATMRVPARGFRITHGTPKFYVKKADSGNDVTRAFCADCGSALYSSVSTHPERIGLRPTSLDDRSKFRSEAGILVKSAQALGLREPCHAEIRNLPARKILTSGPSDRGAAGAASTAGRRDRAWFAHEK